MEQHSIIIRINNVALLICLYIANNVALCNDIENFKHLIAAKIIIMNQSVVLPCRTMNSKFIRLDKYILQTCSNL